MARKFTCRPDTKMNVVAKANTIRIYFTPVGPCSSMQIFVDLKVSNFTRKNGYRVRVPRVLQTPVENIPKDQRFDITFRPSVGESSHLQAFIFDKLADETKNWQVFDHAYEWFKRKKAWTQDVITAWQLHPSSRQEFANIPKPSKRSRSPNLLASIPVNFFSTRCSIMLRLSPSGRLRLYIPMRMAYPHAQKKNFLKVTFTRCKKTMANPGDMAKFGKFVADYIRAAVLNWKTADDAKSWTDNRDLFVKLVTTAWRDCYKDLFWAIKPSRVAVTKQFANLERGSGLFCTLEGKHRIFFGKAPLSHWINYKLDTRSIEERYAIGGKQRDGYTYFLPTGESFITGVIHPGFKVCHSETPTHTLYFNTIGNFYWLKPQYVTYEGDEFTFNYHLRDVFDENA